MKLTLISFGFKNALPPTANIVMDVRFLKNPYWVEDLRGLSGKDAPAGAYIETDPAYAEFMENFKRLLEPLLVKYGQEEDPSLTIAIGCTGGQHRSVYIVEKLAAWMRGLSPALTPEIVHRDL